jgi:8-oxo-dGTP pyrophosphatase MutT (NUDIX family)
MMKNYPRVIAIAVVRRGTDILVGELFDRVKKESFHRPLGGGVEHGEPAATAIQREVKEELGIDLQDLRFLGALENIFTFEGNQGHELVMVFEAKLPREEDYAVESYDCVEDNGLAFKALWRDLAAESPPLYPEGLGDLLVGEKGS